MKHAGKLICSSELQVEAMCIVTSKPVLVHVQKDFANCHTVLILSATLFLLKMAEILSDLCPLSILHKKFIHMQEVHHE